MSRGLSLSKSRRGDRRSNRPSRIGDPLLDILRRGGDLLMGDRVRSRRRGLSRPRDRSRL